MKKHRIIFILMMALVPYVADCQVNTEGIFATFNTNKGPITVQLDYKKAPMTVANFIGLAEGTITNTTYPRGKPFYSGSIWHRVVKGHVIQGGEPSTVKDPANSDANSIGYEIPNEISTLSHNKAGMLGMANGGPHTNTCQYYITLGDRSYLDGNYTLFGEVVEGMDVVNSIIQGDTTFSVTIKRVGNEAAKFIVNDKTFKAIVDRQWAIVNLEKGLRSAREEKYIADNYPGLITAADGLKYKILEQGSGPVAADGSVLTVSYTGKLINGLKFAGTADAGKPAGNVSPEKFDWIYGKEGLIKGIQIALKEMKAGERRLLVITPELAYGVKTGFYGKDIPGQKRFVISPGETLIIELTLHKF